MESESSSFNIGLWKKIALIILILCVVDVFLASYWRVRYGDLLFIEGVVVFAAGAYVAAGVANMRRESQSSLTASPEGHREFLEEQRSKQIADGVLLMIIGAIVIAVSIVFSFYL
jgi:hypothetical protein